MSTNFPEDRDDKLANMHGKFVTTWLLSNLLQSSVSFKYCVNVLIDKIM